MTISSTAEHLQMVDDCEQRYSRLSASECQFVFSVKTWLLCDKPLKEKHAELLDQIWNKATAKG